ncbi:uncharacterized protein LOC122289369 [Carya illinoinensis]|uniref:uncharacterized protein LOC122289369 n=1 Tax=Carya illinoinensis TaxID=32201 RepID=UPI001C71FFF5|nr:uncharacterized protein LOC122289369 [Carya illinoinensis]
MAFLDAQVRETSGYEIYDKPEIEEGEVAANGGVIEGDLAMVSSGGDECGHVKERVRWVCDGLTFAVEDGVGIAETELRIDHKYACPRAYSYTYDDKTSTYTCASTDYMIIFCLSHYTSTRFC